MLNPMAFANSLAALSGAFYLLLYVLAVIWREAFLFLFNRAIPRRRRRIATASAADLRRIRRDVDHAHGDRLGVRLRMGVAVQLRISVIVIAQIARS